MKTKTKFKDVVHLYQGCECRFNYGTFHKGIFKGINDSSIFIHLEGDATPTEWFRNKYEHVFKCILRPLSDITNDEMDVLNEMGVEPSYPAYQLNDCDGEKKRTTVFEAAKITQYLLSKYFDLFGLIESHQAIDSTK